MDMSVDRDKRKKEKNKRKRLRQKLNKANRKDKLNSVDTTVKCLDVPSNGKGCISNEMGTSLDARSTSKSQSPEQPMVDTVANEMLVEKNAMDLPVSDMVSTENNVEKSAVSKKNGRKWMSANKKDELENTGPTNNCLEIFNNGKSCNKAQVGTLDVNSAAQSLCQDQLKVETISTETFLRKSPVEQPNAGETPSELYIDKGAITKKKRRKPRKASNEDKLNVTGPTNKHSGNPDVDLTAQTLCQEQSEMDAVSNEILVDECAVDQLKVHTVSAEIGEKKRRRSSRAKNKNELENMDQTNKCLDVSNSGNSCHAAEVGTFVSVNATIQSLSQEQLKVETVSTENLVEKSAVEQPKIDRVEKSASVGNKRRKSRMKSNNKGELKIMVPTNKCSEDTDSQISSILPETGTSLDVNLTTKSLSQDRSEVDTVFSENVVNQSETRKRIRKRKRVKKKVHDVNGLRSIDQGDTNLSLLKDCNGRVTHSESSVDCGSQRKCTSEHSSAITPECLLDNSRQFSKSAPSTHPRRILLILDINGLLADIVMPPPKECKSDINILGRAIFKRPFYDDFLKFCFETFDVGIWSSRSKRIIDRVVDYLLGDMKQKLLFCWDMHHTTKTEFNTLDNRHKPLVCKELRKLWENCDSDLPWKKGDYDESNTLLIDDSPYKALLNPMNTAIFPHSYTFKDQSDSALGPGGEIRVYLQDLAKTENVQKYVQEHPFGQSAINDKSSDWSFYSEVLHSLSQHSSEIPERSR